MKIYISKTKKLRKNPFKKWYEGYMGLMLQGNKILGISISDKKYLININKRITKRSLDIYIYVPFYCIVIDIIDPWKNLD